MAACYSCPSQLAKPPPSIPNPMNLFSATNIAIEGGEFKQIQIIGADPGFKLLCGQTVPAAFFNAGHTFDLPKCHPGTRVAVLEKIQRWIQGDVDPETSMMWLYGAAGAGKSSIARSIAEWCEDNKLLLASFFFCRSDSQRNNVKPLIATLTYAIIKSVPECRAFIERALEFDPLIFSLSLKDQLHDLIMEPLPQVITQAEIRCRLPHVIIIDGLDECQDVEDQKGLVKLFSSTLCKYPSFGFKVLVASRPEYEIRNSFNDSAVTTKLTTALALSDEYKADVDIRRYLEDNFDEIKQKSPSKSHLPPDWPSTEDIKELVRKSSGQFIYAATVIKYLSSGKRIKYRLRTILDSVGSTSTNGQAELPFAQLDALYRHILTSAGTGPLEVVTQIMALCFLFPRCPSRDDWPYTDQSPAHIIADMLELDSEDVDCILEELNSVVRIGKTSVDFYHKSMNDFLFDSRRSGDLWVDESSVWNKLVCAHLRYISHTSDYLLTTSNVMALTRGLKRAKATEQLTQRLNTLDSDVNVVLERISSEDLFKDDLHLSWIKLLNVLKGKWKEFYHPFILSYDQWLAGRLRRTYLAWKTHVGCDRIGSYPSLTPLTAMLERAGPSSYLKFAPRFTDPSWELVTDTVEIDELLKVRTCVLEAQISAVSHFIHILVENAVTDRLVQFSPAPDSRKSRPWLWRKRILASRMSLHHMRTPKTSVALFPFGATLSIDKSLCPDCLSSTKSRPKKVRYLVETALKSLPSLLSNLMVSSQLVFSLRLASTLTCSSSQFKDLWCKAKEAMTRYLVDVAGLKSKKLGFVFASTVWRHGGRNQLRPSRYEPKRVLQRRVNRKAPSALEPGTSGTDAEPLTNVSSSQDCSELHIENLSLSCN